MVAAVKVRPPRLTGRIDQGEIADAFLAAQVEYLCLQAGVKPPRWTRDPCYILRDPWFALEGAKVRALLVRDAPASFKNRNLFTASEIEFLPRRGRPRKSLEELRANNRLRQQRFRAQH